MKRTLFPIILSICLIALSWARTRDNQWQEVEKALDKGLPQTAISILEEIIPLAIADEAYAEAVKAISLKIVQEGNIQGRKAEETITRMETAMADAPPPIIPILEGILAHWYWDYFQQNNWRFLQRTETSEPPGEDITTWDLATILAEIDQHFQNSLANAPLLKTIPVSDYDRFLDRGNVPDTYRPTLYDFLVYEALSFYSAGEQAGAQSQDRFVFMTDSPIFAPVEEFLQWTPATTDQDSPTLKAIQLYQDLLNVHRFDADKTAFIDADLHRLLFGKNFALGPNKADYLQNALESFATLHADHPIAARARHAWATSLYEQGDAVAAHALASETIAQYPKTRGADWCQNLINTLEAPYASIKTERVWNAPWPDIQVQYRNINKIHFKVYAVDFEDYAEPMNSGLYLSQSELADIQKQEPVHTWTRNLQPTDDYQTHTQSIPVPKHLPLGFYIIFASSQSEIQPGEDLSYTPVWVSHLALVVRDHVQSKVDGFVLKARSGQPVEEAKVTRWIWDSSSHKYLPQDSVYTDEQGHFSLTDEKGLTFFLMAEKSEDALASAQSYNTQAWTHRGTFTSIERTVLFTDRSIYRPGQTIHYKGICIHTDDRTGLYTTQANKTVQIVFRDTQWQEIASHQHTSNDYGSFSGTFTAPHDRLLGQMSLSTSKGYTSIQVEEYKRPSFQVTLEAPSESPRLDSDVTVTGEATTYTGAAIGGGQVQWYVTRIAQLPRWCRGCSWRYIPSLFNEQVIAYGITTTEVNGSFEINFTAKPDLAFLPEDEPIFTYQVHVDVTDPAGETRSSNHSLRIGYTALEADLSTDEWQTPGEPVLLSITTTRLDGVGESVSGLVSLYHLAQPKQVARTPIVTNTEEIDLSDPENWPLGKHLNDYTIQTNHVGYAILTVPLEAGVYRAIFKTTDRYGTDVTAKHTFYVFDPQQSQLNIRVPNLVAAPQWSVLPGETFEGLWGTGYAEGQAYIELECNQEVLESWWTNSAKTQIPIHLNITETMRGGFTLRVTYVRENRAYITERVVDVPWVNKELSIRWEHFRSLLEPGKPETWTAVITGPDARKAVAEMVATLYDASLDQYLPHNWIHQFSGFRHETYRLINSFENQEIQFRTDRHFPGVPWISNSLEYRHYPDFIHSVHFTDIAYSGGGKSRGGADTDSGQEGYPNPAPQSTPDPKPDLSNVEMRTELDETAFFFPHLVSDHKGEVQIEFTTPEALTEWKFMGFAHDNDMRSGFISDSTVTAKDLMVQPNAPRFVREGDTIEFTVKVTNRSAARQTGHVGLYLADARTQESRDKTVGNLTPEQSFDVPSMETRVYAWRLNIPDNTDLLTYKVVGATTRLSDGEEGYLPVLSRQVLVTESLPLPIRGPQTQSFEFTKLLESEGSSTLRHQNLTVQMVSQPAWYAVMALPTLMEQTRESSLATFTRLYADSLGAYIANSEPKIRHIFDQWKATPTLDSPLEKNADLKAIILEETPWIRQAAQESEARRNVGLLFDENRMADAMARAQFKLAQSQYSSGLWPWYPGLRGNEYITLYIVTGYGRLRHLGVTDLDMAPAIKALNALDLWMHERYQWILEHSTPSHNHLNAMIAYYLYGRSFFLQDQAIKGEYQEALNYWLDQAQTYWLSQCRQTQAHLALALKRFSDLETAQGIMASIKEHSVTDDELGMYWRDTERSWWWYRAPIETQAMMIEAFDEVMGDAQAVEDCRVWLLKQKQTQAWKTNRATTDAVYSLLLRGTDWLSSNNLVEVALGGEWIEPDMIEAGTGYYEERFVRGEIKPDMGLITVKKGDEGVSWAGVHWQYLEDIDKVTAYEETPLELKKDLYVKAYTGDGHQLFPINGSLSVGDELVVRLELRVDRDMEYVHLKDQRGSGTEPVHVLSRYRYQDGLRYYESTQDTASHFFMDYLPKGTYVFEYSTRVQHKGTYQSGLATIQCLYAPEFNSHSESYELTVR